MPSYQFQYRGETHSLSVEHSLTARDLLKHLGLSAVYAFVVENGEIVPEDHVLSEASQIEVINAISGG